MATSKVRIAARLRPRLPNELHDDGVRVCHGEPANASCSNSNTGGANTSLNPNNSASLAGANASNSSSGSASSSGSFTGIAVANPRDASQVFRFPYVHFFPIIHLRLRFIALDCRCSRGGGRRKVATEFTCSASEQRDWGRAIFFWLHMPHASRILRLHLQAVSAPLTLIYGFLHLIPRTHIYSQIHKLLRRGRDPGGDI
jgi:hypothetical protein